MAFMDGGGTAAAPSEKERESERETEREREWHLKKKETALGRKETRE